MPQKSALGAYFFFNCPSVQASVCPSLIRVWSISPVLFKVGIPNSMCGYTLGSWSVPYYFRVTVTLTSGLYFRKVVSGA